MLALVDPSDAILRRVPEQFVDLTADLKSGYRWLPVVRNEIDTSTGPDKITTGPVTTVEADQVVDTMTTRDMTAPEIDARIDARSVSFSGTDTAKIAYGQFLGLYAVAKQAVPSLTPAQFSAALDAQIANPAFNFDQFMTWVRARL